MLSKEKKEGYIRILQEELIPATGCTEPIAIAYCASLVRDLLGELPQKLDIEVSGNIVKNVKSVIVPNTNQRRGIAAAAAIGIIAGDPSKKLNVISTVTEEEKRKTDEYIDRTPISISCVDTGCILDIKITGYTQEHSATARIANNHTNIVSLRLDGRTLKESQVTESAEENLQDKSILSIEDIVSFADEIELERLKAILGRQVEYNTAVGEEGLNGKWGAEIGKLLWGGASPDDHKTKAKAYAAAGSDARMSGCELPVIILSGSGNQGITASLPVVSYARDLHLSEDKMYRAIAVSDLISIHQKTGIGRLSAYCGAISAGVGAGAGIAYLLGEKAEGVKATVNNAIAILSGTICDGAKPSCAAKIASAVDAGITGYQMYLNGRNFCSGDGIIGENGVEETIRNVGILASQGMHVTDRVILNIMMRQGA